MLLLQPKAAQNGLKALLAEPKTAQNDSKGFSFVDLLKGFARNKQQEPLMQQDAKEQQSAKAQIQKEMQALLGETQESTDFELLDPKLLKTLDKTELLQLISKAKNYLKAQIEQTPEYKKAEIAQLPNTLGSLVEIAKKFGIEVQKLSVVIEQWPQRQAQLQESAKISVEGAKEQAQEIKIATKEQKPEVRPLKEPALMVSLKKQEPVAQTAKQISIQEAEQIPQKLEKEHIQVSTKAEEQKTQSFALFKEAVTKTASTEQFVHLRQPQTQETNKQTKEKTQDTLALLLRGKSAEHSQTTLTSDFSVETAKVLAPQPSQSAQTTQTALESLLRSEGVQTQESLSVEEKSISKTELGVSTKSESLELKISEAKQMIKYLSSDVKTAIDEYRSPFSRIKLQLNPQKLGELDLTIVQRGNNLHVNMSANNAAINTLALHANELRTQLTNNGINNASLHFSSNTDGGNSQDSNAQQQQQQQNSRGHKEYSYVANEETNEELANSLEIVVPRYI